ncbi:hypothetical protein OOU_Y34scaffold01197g1 [Pyricularia oryzae Y34]|uniref:Uncharacterized protein n=1 Tax=Pyricularia oryzae (strain Y34) TaxID=1143189 RepID=A0AA97NLE4_PYRO3|nr:hypothetical protein OOU_Y34scaffold01197g1 [Pyricularia oryzae Y34]
MSGHGKRISVRKIADEKTLESFLHSSVEDPVKAIIGKLKEVEGVRSAFDLGNGIIFENHPHAISDVAEEVVYRDTPSTPPATPNHSLDFNRLRPDQICVYRSNDAGSERRTMIYISEYKPPHKLTAPHLRVGLRPMNIYKEVVNRKTIPTSMDPGARFQYHAERLTAAAITQTYHYMIEGGLEYGLLTTGEAIVFLKIDWREPETLFYHLAEPNAEVLAHPDHFHLCTAVGQYLAFSLIARTSDSRRTVHPAINLKLIRVSIDLPTFSGEEDIGMWAMSLRRNTSIGSQENHQTTNQHGICQTHRARQNGGYAEKVGELRELDAASGF